KRKELSKSGIHLCYAVTSLTRIFHESLAATTDMAVLPGVLGCRPLRRTVQVRLGTNPAVRGTVARWHAHLLRARCAPLSPASGFPVSRSRDRNS
ncbi:MAG: hypothetical protein WBG91_07275, partial [Syntrophobacteria bacterium]